MWFGEFVPKRFLFFIEDDKLFESKYVIIEFSD